MAIEPGAKVEADFGASDLYMDLIRRFPLRAIRTDAEYDRATVMMNELLDTGRDADADAYLDILSDLVGDYEDRHHPVGPATQADVLRALIEDRGVTQAEVAAGTGISGPNLSAMLAGRRPIGRNSRARLAEFFGVGPVRFVVE